MEKFGHVIINLLLNTVVAEEASQKDETRQYIVHSHHVYKDIWKEYKKSGAYID